MARHAQEEPEIEGCISSAGAVTKRLRALESTVAKLTAEKAIAEGLAERQSHAISNLAHDLRGPLAVIRGYARMILRDEEQPITAPHREHLRSILESADKMLRLMNKIALLDAQEPIRLQSFDLSALWQNALDWNQQILSRKSVTVASQFSETPFLVTADPKKLELGLRDLIAAAVEMSRPGGRVETVVGRSEGHVKLIMSRGGEVRAEDVEGFEGGDGDANSDAISRVHGILGLHGGRLSLNNKPGEATLLTATLPDIWSEVGKDSFHSCTNQEFL
jgi:signal transduction histidine kinase